MANEKNKVEVTLSLLDKATAPFNAFNKKLEAMSSPIRLLNNKFALLGKASGLGKLSTAATGVASSVGGVASEIGSLATKVVASVGIIGGALFGLVKMTSDAADSFDELSTKAGVSASFFQQAAYAASFASVSQESLASAMGKMNANMIGAISGGKELTLWFKRAGLSIKDLKTMKPEQVFGRVMEQLKKYPKESAKAGALAKAIFGKSGGDLLPMVEGFKELTEEAVRLGLVLSDDTVKAGAEFNDTFDKMMKVMKGVGYMIGSILMPYFKEASEAVTTWVLANRELIATKVGEWIATLKENWPEIKQGALDAWAAIKQFAEQISGFVSFIGGFGNALKLLALMMAGPLIMAIAGVVKAIWLLGAAIGGTPVGWFLAAVLAIGLAAKYIYDNWEPISAFFVSLWGDVKNVFLMSFEFLKKLFFDFHPLGIIIANWTAIEDFFDGMWTRIKNKFLNGIESIKEMLSNMNPLALAGKAWDWATNAASVEPGGMPATPRLGAPAGVAPLAAGALGGQNNTQTNNAKVMVDFTNVPKGVQVTPGANNKAPLDLSMGYSMATP